MSFCFSDLTQSISYHRQAKTFLQDLTPMRSDRNRLLFMDDNYFQAIIQALGENYFDCSIIHPDILYLFQYDKKHNSELTLTLYTYLDCNRNVGVMSQQLHINKSTGFYRINQIKELLDDPLSSSKKIFFYECAFQILREKPGLLSEINHI